ncbi:class I SAM-dependent DNA methyltransferase [Kineosporia succinea]|uniref:SAM-dependent methyltransferase n=1 Tax=Kineosporia succinea TaxID=84632 RepID=A0ABT9PDH2_9ACTN|nr:class I SAM-dependent methyltransferase [Kineosporia succinea]MDP9830030.1 SAM-dependent methyltransferase [Kineosporia succinea]
MTSSDLWTEEQAQGYDDQGWDMFSPERIDPVVDFLAGLAGEGAALEFASGTGRIAVPLRRKGIPVSGIELSQPMTDRLRAKISEDELPVVTGDMATAVVPGEFVLVYLVFNTIGNLRTQAEQVRCFRNAARHLQPGGAFVVEVFVPPLRRLPPGQVAVPFEVSEGHTGFDTLDPVTQQGTSHHFHRRPDGTYRYGDHNFRYVWPSELDLMAQLAGMSLVRRTEDWVGTPFTGDSERHVSVWRNTSAQTTWSEPAPR